MEPVIRNAKILSTPDSRVTQLISLEDNPPTCTVGYNIIEPGRTSSHHIHPWEHEVYILEGSGVMMCDGKEYPVVGGDCIFIPGNVEHYTLNNGGRGIMRRIEVNPLSALQQGGARNTEGEGAGQPPIIRNLRGLDSGNQVLGATDGAPNFSLTYHDRAPGAIIPDQEGGHTHPREHLAYILAGRGTLVCDGREYEISEGDAVLVPPDTPHQWRSDTRHPMKQLVFNPIV